MKSDQKNIIVKTEQKQVEMPELGRVHTVLNQGTMEGSFHMQQDMKPVPMEQRDSNQMVQQSEALQNLRVFLQQSSQNTAKPEHFSFPPLLASGHNTPAMDMHQIGGNHGMLQRYWPLLPAPPSFISSFQNLKQFPMANQPSDASWPMPPSTQLSMGPPNPAANYLLRGSSDMSVNSSNRHPRLRENEIIQHFLNRGKMAVKPVDNKYPNILNTHCPSAFSYQVTTKGNVTSSSTCFPRQNTPQTFCVSPHLGTVQQFAGSMADPQEPLKENPQKKAKCIMKQEEDVLIETHNYPPKHVMVKNVQDFLETLDNFSGRSHRTSSSSSRPNRRRGNNNITSLYSIRSKASDFHVDPILRAFAISLKKKGQATRNAGNCRNNSN